jgi:outer membrane protein assembly factor BamB
MFECRNILLLVALAGVLTARGAEQSVTPAAAEWTRFRGPNGSGISPATTIPTTWTDNDYNWKVALPGVGHSSPVVWGDRIFLTGGEEATAKRLVFCLSTVDGSILWRRGYESKTFRKNRDNSYATSSASVDQEHVYIYWTTPEEVTLIALDHQGRDCWRRNLGPFISQHGSGTSPMVYRDLVVVNNDQEGKSSLLALDAKTGATRWEIERRTAKAAYSTPCILEREDGPAELVFTSSAHGISGINPLTGAADWEFTNAFPARVVGSPIVASGLIVASCGEAGVGRRLVAVHPGSAAEAPQLAYEMKTFIPYVPTPLAKDGLLFLWGDSGLVACHRATTGERLWREKISDSFYGSPVWADGRLYCISRTGVVYVLAAAERPQVLATIDLGDPSFATPAIAKGIMYLRTQSHLFSVGGKRPPHASN